MRMNKVYHLPRTRFSTNNLYVILDLKGKLVYKLSSWDLSVTLTKYHEEELKFRIQKTDDLREDRLFEFETLLPLTELKRINLDYASVLVTKEKLQNLSINTGG